MKNQTLILDGAPEVTLRGKVEVTGGQLAALFWEMEGDEQAEFFNTLGSVPPAAEFAIQMQRAANTTDTGGFSAMQVIGGVAE